MRISIKDVLIILFDTNKILLHFLVIRLFAFFAQQILLNRCK